MKRLLLITVLVLVCSLLPISASFGQLVGDGSTVLILGARYEESTLGTYGLGLNIGGGPLWQVTTVDIIDDPSVNVEIIALFKLPIGKQFYAGFVSGLQSKWIDMPSDAPFMHYLQGATGVTGLYGFNEYLGLGGYIKRTYPLEENVLETDWVGGIAFYLRL